MDRIDPEVQADLELRERTARERRRVTDADFGRQLREAATPSIVGKVPCRARCGELADWTAEAEDAFQTANSILASRDEAPLDKTKIAFCDACRKRGISSAAGSIRNHVEALRQAITELKEHPPAAPHEEAAAVKRLTKLRHPCPEECVRSIAGHDGRNSRRRRAEDY